MASDRPTPPKENRMGLFRSYAKFKMGKKIFDWARRKLSSNGGRTRTSA